MLNSPVLKDPFRRNPVVAAHSSEGLLTEPTTDAQQLPASAQKRCRPVGIDAQMGQSVASAKAE
jgi:hypothetical protein